MGTLRRLKNSLMRPLWASTTHSSMLLKADCIWLVQIGNETEQVKRTVLYCPRQSPLSTTLFALIASPESLGWDLLERSV
jgi:hypothetical protein